VSVTHRASQASLHIRIASVARSGSNNNPNIGASSAGTAENFAREVALTYRRARPAGKVRMKPSCRDCDYRRLAPYATGDTLAVSGEVNRMIAAAINADPKWFWEGPEA
jgi:hypothetical protein